MGPPLKAGNAEGEAQHDKTNGIGYWALG